MSLSFAETTEQAEFRSYVREWLRANCPTEPPPAEESAQVDFLRGWQRQLAGEGLVAAQWPTEYGGRGLGWMDNFIVQEELALARAPEIINRMAVNLVGPALMAHGSAPQRARYLPHMLSADQIWCQLFSEPNAGSDLRSLRTVARRRPAGGWEISGSKIWSSWAHYADRAVLLARTDGETGRAGDIGYFLLDMRQAGIVTRPVRQMTGDAEFCEVLLDGAVVDDVDVVGKPADGWNVVRTTIRYERSVSPRQLITHVQLLEHLLEYARANRLSPELRERVAQAYTELTIYRLHIYRVLTELESSGQPSATSSVIKLFWSEMAQRMHELAMDIGGMKAVCEPDENVRAYLYYRACTIFAGTSEIQRDTLAHQVLRMPR